MTKTYRLKTFTYVLGFLSIIINLLSEFSFLLKLLNPLQKDTVFNISFFIFIPLILSILALVYKKPVLMYGAFISSLPLGIYLLSGEGVVQILGLLQILYLISAIFITIDIRKGKKITPLIDNKKSVISSHIKNHAFYKKSRLEQGSACMLIYTVLPCSMYRVPPHCHHVKKCIVPQNEKMN